MMVKMYFSVKLMFKWTKLIKFVLIVILLALNIYQIAVNRFQAKPADVTNVFLKDKIESLDRDVNTVT